MNILIISASTGGGHKRAAAALEDKIKHLNPNARVTVIDGLKAIGKMYDKAVVQGYYFLVKKAPTFYGGLYKITDRENLMYRALMRGNSAQSRKLLAESTIPTSSSCATRSSPPWCPSSRAAES